MQLRLKHPPVPEAAPRHAEECVSAVRDIEGVELDHSVESLATIDGIIDAMPQDGVGAEQVAETLFSFGCYVGEVFVRHSGG